MTDVVVIGGGHNGLVCAAYLARAGKQVTVVEARERMGGLAAPIEFHPGFTSPGVLHDTDTVSPQVVKDLNLREAGLELVASPSAIYLPVANERGVLLHTSGKAESPDLAQHSNADVAALADFQSFIQRISPVINRVLSNEPPDIQAESMTQLWGLMGLGLSLRRLGRDDMRELMRLPSMSVADWLDECFSSDLVKGALAMPAVQTTFAGPMSPGTATNLLFTHCMRSASVKGGPAALVSALTARCNSLGVELLTGARVVCVDGSTVHLSDGSTISAPKCVSACDPQHTILNLVHPLRVPPSLAEDMGNLRVRGNLAKVDLALKSPIQWTGRPGERFSRVRIAPSMMALERAFDATKYGEVGSELCLDVVIPTIEQPSLVPEGHDLVSVLVHFTPFERKGGWTEDAKNSLLQSVIEQLSRHAVDLPSQLLAERVMTPVDLQKEFGLSGGHLFHGEHALDQLASMRPSASCIGHKTPIPDLFLCGAGTHPGGGVSGLCGKLGADAVLKA